MTVLTHPALAFDSIHPQTLLIMTVVIIIGLLMVHRSRTKGQSSRVDARAGAQAQRHQSRLAGQAREDIAELMVRLDELSREICGQIDTRFAKLEHAIVEADAKLAALEAALNRAGSDSPPTEALPPPADPKHAAIYERSQNGQPPPQIAREMGMPVGEIELILSLERSRRGQAAPSPQPEEDAPAATKANPRLDERA